VNIKVQAPAPKQNAIYLLSILVAFSVIIMAFKHSFPAVFLALLGTSFAQSVDGSKYNNPTAGPPASYFAAATTIPVAALQSAAAKASTAASDATYPINGDGGAAKVTIHSDWSKFTEVGKLAS
jgi:chitosanase